MAAIQFEDYVENEFEHVVTCLREKKEMEMICINTLFVFGNDYDVLSLFLPQVLCNMVINYLTPYACFSIIPLSTEELVIRHANYDVGYITIDIVYTRLVAKTFSSYYDNLPKYHSHKDLHNIIHLNTLSWLNSLIKNW